MTTDRHTLVAYIATLSTLVIVLVAGLVAAAFAPNLIGKIEAFGFGTVTGGLIGLAGTFRPRSTQAADTASNA